MQDTVSYFISETWYWFYLLLICRIQSATLYWEKHDIDFTYYSYAGYSQLLYIGRNMILIVLITHMQDTVSYSILGETWYWFYLLLICRIQSATLYWEKHGIDFTYYSYAGYSQLLYIGRNMILILLITHMQDTVSYSVLGETWYWFYLLLICRIQSATMYWEKHDIDCTYYSYAGYSQLLYIGRNMVLILLITHMQDTVSYSILGETWYWLYLLLICRIQSATLYWEKHGIDFTYYSYAGYSQLLYIGRNMVLILLITHMQDTVSYSILGETWYWFYLLLICRIQSATLYWEKHDIDFTYYSYAGYSQLLCIGRNMILIVLITHMQDTVSYSILGETWYWFYLLLICRIQSATLYWEKHDIDFTYYSYAGYSQLLYIGKNMILILLITHMQDTVSYSILGKTWYWFYLLLICRIQSATLYWEKHDIDFTYYSYAGYSQLLYIGKNMILILLITHMQDTVSYSILGETWYWFYLLLICRIQSATLYWEKHDIDFTYYSYAGYSQLLYIGRNMILIVLITHMQDTVSYSILGETWYWFYLLLICRIQSATLYWEKHDIDFTYYSYAGYSQLLYIGKNMILILLITHMQDTVSYSILGKTWYWFYLLLICRIQSATLYWEKHDIDFTYYSYAGYSQLLYIGRNMILILLITHMQDTVSYSILEKTWYWFYLLLICRIQSATLYWEKHGIDFTYYSYAGYSQLLYIGKNMILILLITHMQDTVSYSILGETWYWFYLLLICRIQSATLYWEKHGIDFTYYSYAGYSQLLYIGRNMVLILLITHMQDTVSYSILGETWYWFYLLLICRIQSATLYWEKHDIDFTYYSYAGYSQLLYIGRNMVLILLITHMQDTVSYSILGETWYWFYLLLICRIQSATLYWEKHDIDFTYYSYAGYSQLLYIGRNMVLILLITHMQDTVSYSILGETWYWFYLLLICRIQSATLYWENQLNVLSVPDHPITSLSTLKVDVSLWKSLFSAQTSSAFL